MTSIDPVETLRWIGDRNGFMRCIDQTRLPRELVEIDCRDVATVWSAIRQLQVRGAPAIGIAAAYGLCLAVQSCGEESDFFSKLYAARDYLAGSRPTAVNLGWAGARSAWGAPGRPLSGVGIGQSFLDGLIRVDLSRGLWPRQQWRLDLQLDAKF